VPNVMEIWEPKPPGTLTATPGLLRDSFTFYIANEPMGSKYVGLLARLSTGESELYLTVLGQRGNNPKVGFRKTELARTC